MDTEKLESSGLGSRMEKPQPSQKLSVFIIKPQGGEVIAYSLSDAAK